MLESKLFAADELTETGANGQAESDEEEKPRLRDLFPRTSAEIRVLLS
jgi:hypothetical protein